MSSRSSRGCATTRHRCRTSSSRRRTRRTCRPSHAASRAIVDLWARIAAPQPWIETHLKFYYQVQATVGEQITRVLDALRETDAYENTIVVFSSDHGDMQGAHGGMHEKWHCAYDEALRIPFIVSSPLLPGGAREIDIPTNHADLIPTLLGLAGIDHDEALAELRTEHADARPLVGRDLADAIRAAKPAAPSSPSSSQPTTRSARAAPRAPARSPGSYAACTWLGPSSSPTTSRP